MQAAQSILSDGVKPSGLTGVKNIIAVSSGKGGVGKSCLTVNLASSLRKSNLKVGVFDADISGPSIPFMMGTEDFTPTMNEDHLISPATTDDGILVSSMGMIVPPEQALAWRGPILSSAVNQLLNDTAWGDLDVLLVDCPPGTGDAQLSLGQSEKLSGAVVVTTPHRIACLDARRGIELLMEMGVPVLGLVENMATIMCDECGHKQEMVKEVSLEKGEVSGARVDTLSKETGVPLLGQIDYLPELAALADRGVTAVRALHMLSDKDHSKALKDKISKVVESYDIVAGKVRKNLKGFEDMFSTK
ncbi:putative multi-domain containing protein [Aduncisulcus paluster]|uniref:Multi-domain containing protein n=1 Tax=Aduncisulcus paluster TaxID=2918883 RepID=A0ABQ5JVX7_9EUKA|nr:putative multi-domain containing protein [Aduncisulcus paluster]|eukprot:gnl/Carplike_NY0171/2283_a3077_673.p1 GENE.gnl/Carplike_NY0171/2283_a3077_673~~gnl/Carplike_NY0171/2283_a3077_673.p1  ORF type:complete len:303 (-),score=102.50 gnl/Carplike_NY0171/2283_a3077_673:35-943(-)